MLSNDQVAQPEAQLHRARVLKVEWKAAAEHCLNKEKVAVEAEEQWMVEEAEAQWIVEERLVTAAVARQ